MDELRQNESSERDVMTPQYYFDQIKNKKHTVTSAELRKIYENCIELANKYKTTGQIRGLRKILFCMESIEKEHKLVEMGITTFIYKDDIDFYIDTMTERSSRSDHPVKIIELERYEREIPDEIVDVIAKTKDHFDQMYIVFTDYTGKEERKIAAEKKDKDPILFGTFQDRKQKVCVDRFYYLGDWVDEYCDLTLDKMINQTEKMGRHIVRTINTPKDIKELREYLDAHYEVEDRSISNIIKKADADIKPAKGFFQIIKTFLTRGK